MGYTKVARLPAPALPGLGPMGAGRRPGRRWWPWCVRRNRVALFLVVMGGLSAAVVCLDPARASSTTSGSCPFWFLCLYLLAGYALAEVVAAVARWNRRRRLDQLGDGHPRAADPADGVPWRPGMRISRFRRPVPGGDPPGAVVGPLVALAAACLAVVPPLVLPASTLSQVGVTVGANQPSAWAEWNYSGYERKPDYPEYHAVIQMMAKVGADQGCGRAMWEYDPSLNRFGTTMSLMLLPYWTNGCVDSMEGLLFESASTTPVPLHQPERAVGQPVRRGHGRRLPYARPRRAARDRAPPAAGRALLPGLLDHRRDRPPPPTPTATQVASTGPWTTSYNGETLDTTWKVYGSPTRRWSQPLANRPVVWNGGRTSQASWLTPAVAWYDDPTPVGRGARRRRSGRLDPGPGRADTTPTAVPEPATTVSDVAQTDSSISFHVDRVGTPVEVKVSYFPNWQAIGRRGPVAGGAQPDGGGPDQPRRDASTTASSPADVLGQLAHPGRRGRPRSWLGGGRPARRRAGRARPPAPAPERRPARCDRAPRHVPAVRRCSSPRAGLPLHVFEQRYRRSMADCLGRRRRVRRGPDRPRFGGGRRATSGSMSARSPGSTRCAELDDGRMLVDGPRDRPDPGRPVAPDDPYPRAVVEDLSPSRAQRGGRRSPPPRLAVRRGSGRCSPSSGTCPPCPTISARRRPGRRSGGSSATLAPLGPLDRQALPRADRMLADTDGRSSAR